MPSSRSPDQTVTSFSLPSDLLDVVNRVCIQTRMNRSQLLREALAEKLKGMGIALPTDIVDAPMRLTVMDQPATQPVPESKPTKYPARNVRTKPPIKPKKKGS